MTVKLRFVGKTEIARWAITFTGRVYPIFGFPRRLQFIDSVFTDEMMDESGSIGEITGADVASGRHHLGTLFSKTRRKRRLRLLLPTAAAAAK